MQIEYTPELEAYMKDSGKRNIIVEVASSDSSDIEYSELHIHFVSDKQAELFVRRKGFHRYETNLGTVLLPNYRLEIAPVVTFKLKKVLFIKMVTCDGIKL